MPTDDTLITAPQEGKSCAAKAPKVNKPPVKSAANALEALSALEDATRVLELAPGDRQASLERYSRCFTTRFRRRPPTRDEIDLQKLMPSCVARSQDVWEYTSCAICLVDFADGEALRRAPCTGGHAFHPRCLRGWIDRSNLACPVCRGSELGEKRERTWESSGRMTADAMAEYVMRRMRSGKVDLTISAKNQRKAADILKSMHDPMPCLQEEEAQVSAAASQVVKTARTALIAK